MRKSRFTVSLCGAAFFPSFALAQSNSATIAPLLGFGTNGYLAPGSSTYVPTGSTERGLAFNPLGTYDATNSAAYGGGDLYTTLTGGTIGILSAATGAVVGTLGSASSYTGGTFSIDSIAVAGDGAIYVNNLTTNSSTSPYKIYRYANEAAGTGAAPVGPTVAFSGNVDGARLGDDLAVYGTGSSTVLASGFDSVADGYGITSITAPTGNTTTYATVTGSSNFKDFSSDLTFAANANNVLGSQSSLAGVYRDSTYTVASSTGTLLASPSLVTTAGNPNAGGEHLLTYDVVDGVPLLAVQSTGDGHVSIYDDTNPALPVLLVADNAPAGETGSNGNATGEVAFGSVYNTDEVNLYTLSSGQGIAAYTITVTPAPVPEPASLALLGLAIPGLLKRRRRV